MTTQVFVGSTIGSREAGNTILFQVFLTAIANPAGINHTANCYMISHFHFAYFATNLRYHAHDLMTGNNGIARWAPVAPRNMQVRVADTAEKNIDLHIFCQRLPFSEYPSDLAGHRQPPFRMLLL